MRKQVKKSLTVKSAGCLLVCCILFSCSGSSANSENKNTHLYNGSYYGTTSRGGYLDFDLFPVNNTQGISAIKFNIFAGTVDSTNSYSAVLKGRIYSADIENNAGDLSINTKNISIELQKAEDHLFNGSFNLSFADAAAGPGEGGGDIKMIMNNWEAQETGLTADLKDMDFVSRSAGWAAGSAGQLLSTSNGGGYWTILNTGTAKNLYAVDFVDSEYGWAAGEDGVILHTSNSGSDWKQQNSQASLTLNDIYFFDRNNGWVIGTDFNNSAGTVFLHTTNGGSSWIKHNQSGAFQLTDLEFSGNQYGWACGQNMLLKTLDGGQSWSVLDFTNESVFLDHLHFLDKDTGWAAGSKASNGSMLYKTVNGGNSWKLISKINCEITDIFFLNENEGWMAAEDASYYTKDGGQSWYIIRDFCGTKIYFNSADEGWACGRDGKLFHWLIE